MVSKRVWLGDRSILEASLMSLYTNHFLRTPHATAKKLQNKNMIQRQIVPQMVNSCSKGKTPIKPGFQIDKLENKILILQSMCLNGKRNTSSCTGSGRRYTYQCHDNAAMRQHALQLCEKTDSSTVWPKQYFQQQTLLRTLFARLDNKVSAWKVKTRMRRVAERLTRTELPKRGNNKLAFKNFHKQMKAPYVIYADFKCLECCEPPKDRSFTVKTEMH